MEYVAKKFHYVTSHNSFFLPILYTVDVATQQKVECRQHNNKPNDLFKVRVRLALSPKCVTFTNVKKDNQHFVSVTSHQIVIDVRENISRETLAMGLEDGICRH